MSEPRILRASDVGQYVFCAQAWWLGSVQGIPSARRGDLARGWCAHKRHGQQVREESRLRRVGYLLIGIGLACALAWVSGLGG